MESFLAQSPQCIEKYNNAIDSGVISEMIFEPKSTAGKMVDSLFENMEKESVAYTFATTGLLWQLIGYILEQKSQIAPSSQNAVYRKNKQIKKVLTKIRNDYSKPLTLDDLAEEAQLNKQYFCRAFRQATGKTPIDYLNYLVTDTLISDAKVKVVCFEYCRKYIRKYLDDGVDVICI